MERVLSGLVPLSGTWGWERGWGWGKKGIAGGPEGME